MRVDDALTTDHGDDTKTCPECAEQVLAAAKVCKHCGHRFDTEEQNGPTTGGGAVLGFLGGCAAVASSLSNWLVENDPDSYFGAADTPEVRVACAITGAAAILLSALRLGGIGKTAYRPLIGTLGLATGAAFAYGTWGYDYGDWDKSWAMWSALAGSVLMLLAVPATTRD